MKIKVIITGSTGMVGGGVLHYCLQDPNVEEILVINRSSCGVESSKLKEIIHKDFNDLRPIENSLVGYDACFFCLGISSVGLSKEDYFRITYTLTMHMAELVSRLNSDMTFCYYSGAGTDSTEKTSKMHWAKVKGKTENDLLELPFKRVFALRPGFILPIKGQPNVHTYYKYISWMFPMGRLIYAKGFCKLDELARAMIRLVKVGYEKKVLEGDDIIMLGK
ncbi:NAD-dependent epimerase/dehydratase family protein [Fulvivirga ligni]|uniref:NAD-dependent epimerase/dehydratase family protein n=1 Tax=Fulvivirga ligni TaxID=2904246 RepID=UPI001F324113|nr:NAD-dependent epimerase/dehydratase family protein [Fulvivirga ligni]UII21485.1 NAD-dependent epimerase/dehydratase family protein [Fulvivirga ligni]